MFDTGNPEICQDPPTWGQDDLVLLMITLVSSQKSPTPNISALSVGQQNEMEGGQILALSLLFINFYRWNFVRGAHGSGILIEFHCFSVSLSGILHEIFLKFLHNLFFLPLWAQSVLFRAATANLSQARPNILPQIFLTGCFL